MYLTKVELNEKKESRKNIEIVSFVNSFVTDKKTPKRSYSDERGNRNAS